MTCAQNPHTIACRPGFLSEIAPHVLFSSLPLHLFNLLVKSCLFYAKFSHMSSGETENTQTKKQPEVTVHSVHSNTLRDAQKSCFA